MAVKFTLRDPQNIRKKIQQLAKQAPKMMAAAVRKEAEIEATESKRRTPVDLGNLRASIHVEGPEIKGKSVEVAIVAGGPAAPYALIVHEDLNAYHKVGQAKFIESTLRESAPFMLSRISKRILEALQSTNQGQSPVTESNGPIVDITDKGATIK